LKNNTVTTRAKNKRFNYPKCDVIAHLVTSLEITASPAIKVVITPPLFS
jgi:hypothetical protein